MAKKKSASKVKVELDAKTALRFEQLLRNGLVLSYAVNKSENKKLRLKDDRSVEFAPATIARITEHLRDGLLASGDISEKDKRQLDKLTKKVRQSRAK